MEKFPRIAPDGLLTDKVILITGASQGIGQVTAFGMARAGATVILGARRGEVVASHAAAIEQAGGTAMGLALDVTDEDQVRQAIGTITSRYGRLDGAFNNAGRSPAKLTGLADFSLEDWRAVHAVKVDGTFLCMKYEIPAMIAGGGGAIVNHGSIVALRPRSVMAAGASSQSAIPGMTRVAAAAYAADGVRINMIQTGLVLTPEREASGMYKGREEWLKNFAPIGRAGTPQEIAQAAAWLLSDYASYMTGSIVTVDGGASAGER